MSERDVAIRVEDVTKRFRLNQNRASYLKEAIIHKTDTSQWREFWALKGVSFDIQEGSMHGIIGHNGSGKSTLLRLMANIHRPTTGRITANGRISALLELGTGFHPQLTGRENIYLNASILGISPREIGRRVGDIIEFAGIGDFIDSPVRIYSSGMKVRLGFSVAVHVDPEILLLDEVIAVGDEHFKRRCFDHVYSLRKKGVTIVLVTHSLGQVQSMCDRATWLESGELKMDGDAIEVARAYLQQVNSTESGGEGDDQHEVGLEMQGRGERRGTGEITIEAVTFISAHNRPTPFVNSGRPLVARVRYKAAQPIHNPTFGLRFFTDGGTLVTAPNSRRARFEAGTVDGEGEIVYRIPRVHLTPGTYHVTAGIYDENNLHVYDERQREFELRVQPGEAPDTEGFIDMGGEWAKTRKKLGDAPQAD